MEITVKCNKLFIQDLPAGGSFSLFIFLSSKTSYRRNAFALIVICLANTSTANPVFSSFSGRINGQDPSVFSGVLEIPTLSGLWEKITPD